MFKKALPVSSFLIKKIFVDFKASAPGHIKTFTPESGDLVIYCPKNDRTGKYIHLQTNTPNEHKK